MKMVKIPELAEDGQNWKIYCAKFLEVTATYDCLEVLAGRPYEGDDWDGCNALLCCTLSELVPPMNSDKSGRKWRCVRLPRD